LSPRPRLVVALRVLAVVLLLAVWEFFPRIPDIREYAPIFDPFFISSPSRIAAQFWKLASAPSEGGGKLTSGNLLLQFWSTLYATLIGFVLGVGTGFIAGLALAKAPFANQVLRPFLVAFNALPRIALVPLVVMILGTGLASKLAMAWLIVFFIVLFNTVAGAQSVERALLQSCRLLGASSWDITRTVIIPHVAGWTFAILPVAMAASIVGVVVGEFIGGTAGLGYVITLALGQLEATDMFVALILLSLLTIVLVRGMNAVERRLLHWRPEHAETGAAY
jgi:NitT/TauT family transport system permease protein